MTDLYGSIAYKYIGAGDVLCNHRSPQIIPRSAVYSPHNPMIEGFGKDLRTYMDVTSSDPGVVTQEPPIRNSFFGGQTDCCIQSSQIPSIIIAMSLLCSHSMAGAGRTRFAKDASHYTDSSGRL
jgi:hypothetical protein